MVTAYFLDHNHWTVIPHQIEDDFKDMVDCGFNAVAISFSESEMAYARRSFEIQIRLAKKQGLKCFVIPSRLGGRFAGAPLMPSMWLATHQHFQVPGNQEWPVACLESEEFREWIRGFMTILVSEYDIDGIIWDEPTKVDFISKHQDTIARYGINPSRENMMDGFVEFLKMLTAHSISLKSALSITLFSQKTDPEYFTARAAHIPGIEYCGYDGNLAPQSVFHEKPSWCKYRIESVWDRTLKECGEAKKKTFALIENMLMPASAIHEYEKNLECYLQTYHPDHLSIYYYAHNNEDPEKIQGITRRLMKKYL